MKWYKKLIVFGIISLFIGFCFNPIINAHTNRITPLGNENYAIIVRGPGDNDIGNTALFANKVFENSDYTTICLDYPFKSTIQHTLVHEISEDAAQVFLYFICHGYGSGTIKIRDGIYLNPNELNDWVEEMENTCNPSLVTILIDACFSGLFTDELSNTGRIIITSTDHDSYSWLEYVGAVFSLPFFTALKNGETYADAWETADRQIHEEGLDDDDRGDLYEQNPQIEDTGNGISVGSKGIDTLPIWDRSDITRDGSIAGKIRLNDKNVQISGFESMDDDELNPSHLSIFKIITNYYELIQFYLKDRVFFQCFEKLKRSSFQVCQNFRNISNSWGKIDGNL